MWTSSCLLRHRHRLQNRPCLDQLSKGDLPSKIGRRVAGHVGTIPHSERFICEANHGYGAMKINLQLIAVGWLLVMAPISAGANAAEQPELQIMNPSTAVDVPVPRTKPENPAAIRIQGNLEKIDPIEPMQMRPVYDAEQFDMCVRALRDRNVKFDELPAQVAIPPCGITRPIRVNRLSSGVQVTGKPTLNCATVLALDTWVTSGVQVASKIHLDTQIQTIGISTSYQCRRRNNASNGKFSEHAFGNGIDVVSFSAGDNVLYPVQPYESAEVAAAQFQAQARSSACEHFTTVLGPGSNAAHSNHFHLDLAIRRGGFRLCE